MSICTSSKPMALLLFLVTSLGLSGCYTMQASVPGVLRSDVDEQVEVIGGFDIEFTQTYTVWGAVSPHDDDALGALIQEEVEAIGGDGVANLLVESRFDGWDFISRIMTIGFLAPRTYRVRGDIVRIHAPAMRGRPVLRRGMPSPLTPPPLTDDGGGRP